jgi:hypothetical protein
MKASFSRILIVNLVLILGVAVVLRIPDEGPQNKVEGLGFVIRLAFAIGFQFFLNALLGLIARSQAVRQSFWTAALVTLLIGFGACVGGSFSY